jgi:hypothetical protein
MTDQPREYITAQVREYERQRIIERFAIWAATLCAMAFVAYVFLK